MSTPIGVRSARLGSDSSTPQDGSAKGIPDSSAPEMFSLAVAALRAELQTEEIDRTAFLHHISEQARQFTSADSTVIALRQSGPIVCVARAGAIGPPPGAAMDSRSGISGECLRRGKPLRCDDSEKDARVDAEVCRRLGIRSLVVVPVFEGREVAGLLEAFSSRPNAFQDPHVSMLEQLASLVEGSKWQTARDSVAPFRQDAPVLVKRDVESQRIADPSPGEQTRNWAEAFRLRPYQVVIVVLFLLLDVMTIYWWQSR